MKPKRETKVLQTDLRSHFFSGSGAVVELQILAGLDK